MAKTHDGKTAVTLRALGIAAAIIIAIVAISWAGVAYSNLNKSAAASDQWASTQGTEIRVLLKDCKDFVGAHSFDDQYGSPAAVTEMTGANNKTEYTTPENEAKCLNALATLKKDTNPEESDDEEEGN